MIVRVAAIAVRMVKVVWPIRSEARTSRCILGDQGEEKADGDNIRKISRRLGTTVVYPQMGASDKTRPGQKRCVSVCDWRKESPLPVLSVTIDFVLRFALIL